MIKTRLVQVVESRFVPNKYGEFHIIPDQNFVQSLAANPARRIGIDRHRSDLVEFFSQDHWCVWWCPGVNHFDQVQNIATQQV